MSVTTACSGLSSQRVPRIEKYSAERVLAFADEMNGLPRKQLGYRIPGALFDTFLDRMYAT